MGMKKKGTCVHFNGIMNQCCDAGVNYKELAGDVPGYGNRIPCISKYVGPGVVECDKRQEPTDQQIAEYQQKVKESMERVAKIRKAIVDEIGPWKKGTPGTSGSIPCPCCDGEVSFSRAGYNGHVHARCSSPDCASWME